MKQVFYEVREGDKINALTRLLYVEDHLILRLLRNWQIAYSFGNIAAAALYAAFGEIKVEPTEKYPEKIGMKRLFMTIGRKDNVQVADIAKSIASGANITHSKIGKIKVLDKFTFVEVHDELADRVVRSMDDMIMKGIRVKVQ